MPPSLQFLPQQQEKSAENPQRITIENLSFPEQIVIWSLRALINRPNGPQLIETELQKVLGSQITAGAAAYALKGLLNTLAVHCRRMLTFHKYDERLVSHDERTFLALVAAAQAGQKDHANAVLSWVVRPAAASLAGIYARDLAEELAKGGRVLPLPPGPDLRAIERRPIPVLVTTKKAARN